MLSRFNKRTRTTCPAGSSVTASARPLMVIRRPAVPLRAASRGTLNGIQAPCSSTCQVFRLSVRSCLKPLGSRSSTISGPTRPRPSSSELLTCGWYQ
ncbi:hypothetical protein D3C79_808350 [compost metagenome]